MGQRSLFRQDAQIQPSKTYDDEVTMGSTMESAPTQIENDLNSLRSVLRRHLYFDEGSKNWYDDIPAVQSIGDSKTRGISQIATHVDSLEEHRFLFRTQVIEDVAVGAAAAATGSVTGIVKGSLADGDYFTVGDGTNDAKNFYFDVTGTYTPPVDPDNIEVDISGTTTAINVADAIRTAMTGAADFDVSPDAAGAALINLTNDNAGTAGNVTITESVTTTLTPVGMTGGTGDVVVLSQASSEVPSIAAAVTANAKGTVVAVLAGDVGSHDMAEQAGPNALRPYNLCKIIDSSTGDAITSGGREVFALIQAESGVTDGDAFNDTDHQVQLSFVRENSALTDLEPVPGGDIGGKTIRYAYVRRLDFDNLPQWAWLFDTWADQGGAADVTLDAAIDNQVGPATQTDRNIDWRITDSFTTKWQTSDGGVDLLAIKPAAGGDEVEINVDDFDVNNVNTADFLNGVTVDSGGTPLNFGVTAGQIDAAAELTLATTGANDLNLTAGALLAFTDQYQAASGYDTDLVLSDSSQEWDDYETEYGEVSLLNAIVKAGNKGGHSKRQAIVTTTAAAGVNVTGAGGTPNIDTQLQDYSALTFIDDVNVYLNGQLLRNAVGATEDVYPGTSQANGDLMFTFSVLASPGNPDVITMETFGPGGS